MVRLLSLSDSQFSDYREELLQRYAASIVKAWQVDQVKADGFATLQVDSLLSDGNRSRFHQLRRIVKHDVSAGVVWFSSQPGSIAYIYDLYIEAQYRRKGIGREVVRLVEEEARVRQCFAVSLHVFEENAAAQDFYRVIGLRPIGTQLFKHLHDAGAA